MRGIINLRYEFNGMHFDAAIDYGRILYSYTNVPQNMLPIELYNLDRPEWDIQMMFVEKDSSIELKDILDATSEWCINMFGEDV